MTTTTRAQRAARWITADVIISLGVVIAATIIALGLPERSERGAMQHHGGPVMAAHSIGTPLLQGELWEDAP